MFKLLRNNKGQGIAIQYVLTFFLVLGVVFAMSLYLRRAIQAKIRDARTFMLKEVKAAHSGNTLYGYEPYYANSMVRRVHESTETRRILPSYPLSSGIFQVEFNQTTQSTTAGDQAPPRDADKAFAADPGS